MTAAKVILVLAGVIFLWLALYRISRKFYHSPAPAILGPVFDSNFRRWIQSPAIIIERSGIKPGMVVLELGCGSGAFTSYIARVVGASGKVYAVDIQPAMLRQLARKLSQPENRDIKNVELRQANAYDLPFNDESIDLVCLVGVLQEIPDRGKALREIQRVLKADGILAVTELLPDPDYPRRSTTVKVGQREGFTMDDNVGNLWHYTVKFKKTP